MASRALAEGDDDVGLYRTSHTDGIQKHIRINGANIPKSRISMFVEKSQDTILNLATDGTPPTFAQTMLALAFWEFDYRDVDLGVIEVNSDIEFTTTNVLTPETTAISDLDDGDDQLWETFEQDFSESTVSGTQSSLVAPDTTMEELEITPEASGDITTVGLGSSNREPNIVVDYTGRRGTTGTVSIEGEGWHVQTDSQELGDQGAIDAGVAAGAALDVADLDGPEINRGLRVARTPGHFELMSQSPLVVLDSADDRDGCKRLMDWLDEFDYDQRHLVFGGERGVDYRGIADVFSGPQLGHVLVCQPEGGAPENVAVIERAFEQRLESTVTTRSDGGEGAVDEIMAEAEDGDTVVVTGSASIVREARKRWSRNFVTKQIEDISDSKEVLRGAHVTSPGVWRIKGKGVHRAVKTRLRRRGAQYVKLEMLSLGGECAISGLSNEYGEYFDVVLLGTLAQYKRLAEKLDSQPYGLGQFANRLRNTVEIRTSGDLHSHPWGQNPAVIGTYSIGSQPDTRQDSLTDTAKEKALKMLDMGADIIDVTCQTGGSEEHPGVVEEAERVTATVEALAGVEIPICVTTPNLGVAESALTAGADVIYDGSESTEPRLMEIIADYDASIVMRAPTPVSTNTTGGGPDDIVEDMITSFTEAVLIAERAGIPRSRIILDPAVDRVESTANRLEMMERLDELHALGSAVLVNRPIRALGEVLDIESSNPHSKGIAASIAIEKGADILRVAEPEPAATAVSARSMLENRN